MATNLSDIVQKTLDSLMDDFILFYEGETYSFDEQNAMNNLFDASCEGKEQYEFATKSKIYLKNLFRTLDSDVTLDVSLAMQLRFDTAQRGCIILFNIFEANYEVKTYSIIECMNIDNQILQKHLSEFLFNSLILKK